MELVCSADPELARPAAWAFGKAGENCFYWITPHLPQLICALLNAAHPAISRNVYRALQKTIIPEKYASVVLDLCLRDIGSLEQPVAVKVYAMTTAAHIAEHIPELKTEVALVIQSQLHHASPGYRSRATKSRMRLK